MKLDTFLDRKSTRLNSSHMSISYAVVCLKKKSDDQAGETAVHQLPEQLEQFHLVTDVERGGWLVQHQRARLLSQRPRDAHPLFFVIRGRPHRSTLFPYTALFR